MLSDECEDSDRARDAFDCDSIDEVVVIDAFSNSDVRFCELLSSNTIGFAENSSSVGLIVVEVWFLLLVLEELEII